MTCGAEFLADMIGEGGDVVDHRRVDVGFGRDGVERRRRGGLHGIGTYRVDQLLLQAKQVGRWFDHDPAQADRPQRDVVVFERGQFSGGVSFLRQDPVGCVVDRGKIGSRDKTGEYRDVRMVRLVQREALGEILQQGGIRRLGVTDHRLARLEGNVDRRDRGLRRAGVFSRSERHGNIDGDFATAP